MNAVSRRGFLAVVIAAALSASATAQEATEESEDIGEIVITGS